MIQEPFGTTGAERAKEVPRQRGRPQQLPRDYSPALGHRVDADKRVAWLLATSRLLGDDPLLTSQEGFARAMRNHGLRVDNSRISRWESGGRPAPIEVVAAYEKLLGLPAYGLVSVIVGLRRTTGQGKASTRRTPSTGFDQGELDDVFIEIDSGQPSGTAWLKFARLVTDHDQIYLSPTTWPTLAGQLVNELGRAIGAAFVRRLEACHLLMTSTIGQKHMLHAIGQVVTDPHAQVMEPSVGLLAGLADPGANALLFRLLKSNHPLVRGAAASVAPAKTSRGHFSKTDLEQLEAHTVLTLRHVRTASGGLHAIDQAATLPDDSFLRIVAQLHDDQVTERLHLARQHGLLVNPKVAQSVAHRLASRAQQTLGGPLAAESDTMLSRLITEVLFNVHKERRQQAGLVLAASPYAAAVADGCLTLSDDNSELVAARGLAALQLLGLGQRRAGVINHVTHPTSTGTLRVNALNALALSPEEMGSAELEAAQSVALGDHPLPVRQAAMFAIGMNGPSALPPLRRHGDSWAASAASWWLTNGSALRDPDDTSFRRPYADPAWVSEVAFHAPSPTTPGV